jgi:hypothetical protein
MTNKGSEERGQSGALGEPEDAIECSGLQDVSE